jgi:hypothetical protein
MATEAAWAPGVGGDPIEGPTVVATPVAVGTAAADVVALLAIVELEQAASVSVSTASAALQCPFLMIYYLPRTRVHERRCVPKGNKRSQGVERETAATFTRDS